MEQVVPKLQNQLKQLRFLAGVLPAFISPTISDLLAATYEPAHYQRKYWKQIRMNSGLNEIEIANCMKKNGRIQYRGNLYVPVNNALHAQIIEEYHNMSLAGHPGSAKTFHLLDQHYYCKQMQKDVDQVVPNCHSCQWSCSSRHWPFGVLQPLPVHSEQCQYISVVFRGGVTRVWRVRQILCCSGQTPEDAMFDFLLYKYRCIGTGGVVFQRCSMTTLAPIDNCLEPRTTVYLNILGPDK